MLMGSAGQEFRTDSGAALPCSMISGISVGLALNGWTRRICLQDGFLTLVSGTQAGMGEKEDKPGLWTVCPAWPLQQGGLLEGFLVNKVEVSRPFITEPQRSASHPPCSIG